MTFRYFKIIGALWNPIKITGNSRTKHNNKAKIETIADLKKANQNLCSANSFIYQSKVRPSGKIVAPHFVDIE